MRWIDKVIGAFSPERAYQRALWREALAERGYDSGLQGRPNTNWAVFNQSAQLEDQYDRDLIRARARDMERNSDIANSILLAFRRNVVGRGYKLTPRTGDLELDKTLSGLWREWCKARNCDVTGQQSLTELLRMCVVRKKVDGGVLLLKRYTGAGRIPFQLQVLEVDELDNMAARPHRKNHTVVDGVEYDMNRRAVGYWFRQYDATGYQSQPPVWVDGKDVIFYFSKKRPSQLREISDLAPVLTRVRDANELLSSAAAKSKVATYLSVMIKRVANSGVGRNNPAAKRASYDGKTLSPGMLLELNPGDDVQVVNPNNATDDATDMVSTLLRMMGSAFGLSYEAVSRDMSQTNYSSARQGMIEDNETYAEEIERVKAILDEIYETFLISVYLTGAAELPGFWENKRAYMAHTWDRAPKPWIDPTKEASANKLAVQAGQKTFQQIAAENGKDWKEQIDDMAQVVEYAREKGLEIGGVIYGQDIQSKQGPEQPV